MKRIAIIGGGISGLSAAFALEEQRAAGVQVDYTLYESSSRLGGVLRTERVDGCLIEAGPDSFITEKPWAAELCRQLGIGDQLIGSNDAARKTYIVVKGLLVPIPDGLMFLVPTKITPAVLSPLFSLGSKLRMAREWFHPPRRSDADETVASLVERHYGREVVERLADPMLSGVYGGEAGELSVRAVLPRFAEMEAQHGSLGRAMVAARKKMAQTGDSAKPPLFTSLKDGMQQLTDTLLTRLPPKSLRTNSAVQTVQSERGSWLVSAGYKSDVFDAVIIATPAGVAATLLQIANPALAAELAGIRYSSSATVALGYAADVRAALPAGFGFLVPRTEALRMLAATFVHNKFPHRAPRDRALIRCFFGGSRDEAVLNLDPEQIVQIARQELRQILGISAEPLFTRVFKWPASMAQYAVGHLEKLARIERLRRDSPGLALAGNAYRGIGVPDCVRSGKQAVAQSLEFLGMAEPEPAAAR
ncbi:MAG TPA: protoporphyrinogen oxidase [Terriglobales bacterium]|nr:protoporphyrinogen oxidase [Terriglobales bacterium]